MQRKERSTRQKNNTLEILIDGGKCYVQSMMMMEMMKRGRHGGGGGKRGGKGSRERGAGNVGPKGELVVYEEEILDTKRKKIIT